MWLRALFFAQSIAFVHRALLIYTELHNPGKALCCNNGDVTPKMPVQSCITLAQRSRKRALGYASFDTKLWIAQHRALIKES